MVDWGALALKTEYSPPTTGVDLLEDAGSRGFSMARTLGSEEADQVSMPGRRVLIGWTGPADGEAFDGQGSAQSLPRDLSLASDKSLLQKFVPELQSLRLEHQSSNTSGEVLETSLQVEVQATFPGAACGAAKALCGVKVLDDGENATLIQLWPSKGLVLVDATSQGNTRIRAGPLPALTQDSDDWEVHAIVDHSLVEVIVNGRTAFIVYAAPGLEATGVSLSGVEDAAGAKLDAWTLDSAHNDNTKA